MVVVLQREGRVGAIRPFDESGVVRAPEGFLAYESRPRSLVEMFETTREEFGSRTALSEPGRESLTYEQLWIDATRLAGGLRALGVQHGDRVAISLVNGIDWVRSFVGTILAGAVVVPVNHRLTADEIGYILSDSGTAFTIDSSSALPFGPPFVERDIDRADPAAIFYTSGTTGRPKGAVLSHRNLLSISESSRRINGYRTDERFVSMVTVPLFHVTGCNAQLMTALETGGTAVLLPRFEVSSYIEAVAAYRATTLVAVPAMFAMALQHEKLASLDTTSVRQVVYGGAPMPPQIIAKLRKAFPGADLGNGYGLTETSSVSTRLPDAYCDGHPESVGMPTPVVEVDLRETDDNGVGELVIRGENVFSGYWGRDDATDAVMDGGWFRTGDVASIDDDGFCQIVDRRKDVIIRGGENVYSVEVENALIAHAPLLEAAVVPVADDVYGERVGAVVVPLAGSHPSAGEILEALRQHLAPYKLPEYIVVSEEGLPRNPGGKVLKRELQSTDWGQIVRLSKT
jgi:long-chain acyl-CoA synthetase